MRVRTDMLPRAQSLGRVHFGHSRVGELRKEGRRTRQGWLLSLDVFAGTAVLDLTSQESISVSASEVVDAVREVCDRVSGVGAHARHALFIDQTKPRGPRVRWSRSRWLVLLRPVVSLDSMCSS